MLNDPEIEKHSERRSLDGWIDNLIGRFNEVVYEVLTEINQVFDEVF